MEKYKLPAWQLFCHIIAIYCFLTFNWQNYIAVLFMYFITGCLGITVTFHRLLTHKSYTTHDWIKKLGTIFGTLGGVGSSIGWVSVHREHHRYSDTSKDPHSPKNGFWHAFYGSIFKTPKIQYVTDLARDRFQITVHKYYWTINITYAILLLLIGGFELWATLHILPSFILWTTMSIVNTFSHIWGYKNFADTRDDSRNNWFSALIAWGEGWHNNHHADPLNHSFQVNWWEIDISKQVIKIIRTNA
jgi:stearoyl-CoA desaturase (delta-9 desaturase)